MGLTRIFREAIDRQSVDSDRISNYNHPMTPSPKSRYFLQSLAKGLNAIQKFVEAGGPVIDEELSLGGRAVATPVVDKHGVGVAAINIGVPTIRYSLQNVKRRMVGPIQRIAERIFQDLQRIEAEINT